MSIYHQVIASTAVPWRFRNRLERWVESVARTQYPGLYRWLHFGRAADPVKPLTKGPLHHFYGYYDKSPWNASGSLLLGHEADFNDRAPKADDRVGIGVIRLNEDGRFEKLTDSFAWNWQQGSMAQWHPADPERLFIHNDRRDGRFVGIVRDVEKGEIAVLDRPVYAVLPDGRTGFSLNFARLAVHRPGYGYEGGEDPYADHPSPREDGIGRMDLATGQADLIVSLADLASRHPKPSMEGAWHYVNHIQPSRNGKRIAFFHIWHKDEASWEVRLYTCRPDGTQLTCLLDTGFISHYDWKDDETILIWANRPEAPARFLMVTHPDEQPGGSEPENAPFEVFGEGILTHDGHCSFSPDRKWVLNDTYPDTHQMRTLMVLGAADAKRFDIARLYSPKSRWWGEIRCDLHPRWSRDGRQVCIDSVHDGSRQIYVVDVEQIVG